jgi:cellulose synthase/poly-beta-1,6-N-acetylglucosamine synthase-like glycosyltransferase
MNFPKISIIIAARNEEANIEACLQALDKLDYPAEKLEVWLGNDASTDRTGEIIAHFIENKPNFHLINLDQHFVPKVTFKKYEANGKVRVLANLAHEANGDYFFFTDADTQIPPTWIKDMLPHFKDNVGIVAGWTLPYGHSLFHHLQTIEWLWAWQTMKLASDLKVPVAVMGNNMAVSREAYEKVGGYENLPFSMTEDLELFRQIINKKFQFRHAFSPESLAITEPIRNWPAILQQRKRWLKGGVDLPFHLKITWVLHTFWLPILLALAFYWPRFSWTLMALIFFGKMLWGVNLLNRIKRLKPAIYLPLFEIYNNFWAVIMWTYYFLPTQVEWKGRKYD